MSNEIREVLPTQLTEAKGTNLARELFTSNFWMSGLAMLRYLPRSFRVKQIDGMAFFTESKHGMGNQRPCEHQRGDRRSRAGRATKVRSIKRSGIRGMELFFVMREGGI